MDVTLHNTNIATLNAFIKRRHNMTSSYDWPCSLQIYSTQMPHARCRIRANIRIFCGHPRQSNFRRILCLPASTVRIYASTHLHFRRAIIYAAHTHTSTAVSDAVNTTIYSRAQLRRARRNETLNCRRNSRDERTRGGQIDEQHVRHDNARPKSTYVRSPNMSTSISQFWELPLLRPECNEEQRAFTLDARHDLKPEDVFFSHQLMMMSFDIPYLIVFFSHQPSSGSCS